MNNLWTHQKLEVEYAARDRRFLFWEPRTGKTRAVIGSAEKWIETYKVSRILIIAPLISCRAVWMPESLALRAPGEARVEVLDSGSAHALKTLQELSKPQNSWDPPQIVIINYDLVSRAHLEKLRGVMHESHPVRDALRKWGPQAVVFDECHYLRTPSSARTAACRLIANDSQVRFVRGLTGTPTPRDFGNLYGQFRVVDPGVFGTRFTAFRDRYLATHERFPSKVIGYHNLEELKSKALSISSVIKRAQCMDIPKVQEITRKIELPENVRLAYAKLVKQHVAELENIGTITAEHILPRLLRLQQLTSGYARLDDEENKWVHTCKIQATLEELDEIIGTGERAVIFYRFTPEGTKLAEAIRHKYGPVMGQLDGKTPSQSRARLLELFDRADSNLRVMLVQEQTGSVSISLRAASHAIFYSYGFDQAVHTQARDRIFKPDPEAKLTYTTLECPGTIDESITSVLRQKTNAAEFLLRRPYADLAQGR